MFSLTAVHPLTTVLALRDHDRRFPIPPYLPLPNVGPLTDRASADHCIPPLIVNFHKQNVDIRPTLVQTKYEHPIHFSRNMQTNLITLAPIWGLIDPL